MRPRLVEVARVFRPLLVSTPSVVDATFGYRDPIPEATLAAAAPID